MGIICNNPYALYVCCDGAMDYNSKNSGGIGFEIIFPESFGLESIKHSFGKYEGANIERLELEAILQGMNEVNKLFKSDKEKFKNIHNIIFTTDRLSLNDKDKTNPYRIRDWRKNNWNNHEGKAIKNSDLLDKIDKIRKKLSNNYFCSIEIQYRRRKFNKTPDKLAKKGKESPIVNKNIAIKGLKLGKRKFDNIEVDYNLIEKENEYIVHVFKKEPVRNQWEIYVDICNGYYKGRKLRIYTDSDLESKFHRHHEYLIKIKDVFNYHVTIHQEIEENK